MKKVSASKTKATTPPTFEEMVQAYIKATLPMILAAKDNYLESLFASAEEGGGSFEVTSTFGKDSGIRIVANLKDHAITLAEIALHDAGRTTND